MSKHPSPRADQLRAMREAQLLFDSLLQTGEPPKAPADLEEFWRQSTALWSALVHSDAQQIRDRWPAFLLSLIHI